MSRTLLLLPETTTRKTWSSPRRKHLRKKTVIARESLKRAGEDDGPFRTQTEERLFTGDEWRGTFVPEQLLLRERIF